MQSWIEQADSNKAATGQEYAVIKLGHDHCQVWPVSRIGKIPTVYRTDQAGNIDWSAAMEQLRDKFEGVCE